MNSNIKRPLSIVIFSLIMFLTAFVTIIANAYINVLPLWGAGNIFSKMAVMDIVVIAIYPVAAVAIYSVKKTGWWIFIISATFIFVYNIIAFVKNPMVSIGSVILFNAFLFAGAGFFFRRHIIAPYFNPRLRWWEQASRYNIDLGVSIQSHDLCEIGYLEDISQGGCFIRIPADVKVGFVYSLRISLGNILSISVMGRVMRILSDEGITGFGFMFYNLSETERQGLIGMMDALQRLGLGENPEEVESDDKRIYGRYSINISASILYKHKEVAVRLMNLSATGAYVRLSSDLEMGSLCGFLCSLGDNSVRLDAIVK